MGFSDSDAVVQKGMPASGLKPCGHMQEVSPGTTHPGGPTLCPACCVAGGPADHPWRLGRWGQWPRSCFSRVPSRGAAVSAGETSWVAPFPFISEPPGSIPSQQGPFCLRRCFSHCIFHTHFVHVMMLYFLLTYTISRPADKFCTEVCKPWRLESPLRGKSTGFEWVFVSTGSDCLHTNIVSSKHESVLVTQSCPTLCDPTD